MNEQLNASFKIVAFAAFLCFVTGCASTSTPTPSIPAILGTWVGTVTEANAPVIGGLKTSTGEVELTFSDNGRFLVSGLGEKNLGGYTLAQDKIVIKDETSSCLTLRVPFPTATYKWSVENDILTLTAIDDGCYMRRISMEGEDFWKRKTTFGTPVPTTKPLLK